MQEMPEIAALFSTKSHLDGISPIERLLNEFEAHEAKEEKSIEDYKRLVHALPNPVTKFLLQLIISDEEKHRDSRDDCHAQRQPHVDEAGRQSRRGSGSGFA